MVRHAQHVEALVEWADRAPNEVQFSLDKPTVISLIGQLQLAQRHPLNSGVGARASRHFIDQTIAAIESEHPIAAEALRLGNDPANDDKVPPAARC